MNGDQHLIIFFEIADNLLNHIYPKYQLRTYGKTFKEDLQKLYKTKEFYEVFVILCDFCFHYVTNGLPLFEKLKIKHAKIKEKEKQKYNFLVLLKYSLIKPSNLFLNKFTLQTSNVKKKKKQLEETKIIPNKNQISNLSGTFDLISNIADIDHDTNKKNAKKTKNLKHLLDSSNIDEFRNGLLSNPSNIDTSIDFENLCIKQIGADLILKKSLNFSNLFDMGGLDEFIVSKSIQIDFDNTSKYLFYDETLNHLINQIQITELKLLN